MTRAYNRKKPYQNPGNKTMNLLTPTDQSADVSSSQDFSEHPSQTTPEFLSTSSQAQLSAEPDCDASSGLQPQSLHNLASAPDPFDPARFAARGTLAGEIGVVRQLVTCPVRKPNRQEFVRVHSDPSFRLQAHILELKDERETYLVLPEVATELPGETRVVDLRLAVSRQGAIFLWPVPVPSLDGRENDWWVSARAAADSAERAWTRMVASNSQGAYDVYTAKGVIADPAWPDKSMSEILVVAFGEKFIIQSTEHPVIRRLLGLS